MDKASVSLWMADAGLPNYESLGSDLECGVLIVGAGIAGLSTAYMLCQEGVDVIVVDDGGLASGETERTTAHITAVLDSRYSDLEKWHGADAAKLIAESQRAAINVMAEIIERQDIACDFTRKNGYLFLGEGMDREILDHELEAMQRCGFTEVELLPGVPLPFSVARPCLKVPDQAQFNVIHYLRGLIRAIAEKGGKFFCDTHVTSIKEGLPAEVLTDSGHTIRANNVVIATNSPISNLVAIHTKQSAYRSYALCAELPDEVKIDGLFWDTEHPYHYLRTQISYDKNYLIVGGEDRKTGRDEEYEVHFDRLEKWCRAFLPELGAVEFTWSGQLYEPVDGIPYIGHDPGHRDNVYVATGFSGVGMTQATVAGMILSDAIMGRSNIYSHIFNPTRKTVATVETYVKANVNVAAQYADHLKNTEISEESILPGEGAIICDRGEKLAVYRDDWNQLHRMSAICPHMKAVVRWNPVEKSWDCPAHGSRFDSLGGVIDGPANCDLSSCPIALDLDERVSTGLLAPDDGLMV